MIDKIINWLIASRFLIEIRKFLVLTLAHLHLVIVSYNYPQKAKVLDLIAKIRRETEMPMSLTEGYQIFMVVKATNKIPGDLAEVGVYKGSSSKIICEAKENRPLHLFDTFAGIPEVEEIDKPFYKGQYSDQTGRLFEVVQNYLKDYENLYFYKGWFPETAEKIKEKRFSFVNLDVDTRKSTQNCLEFFYPRMNPGGIIISHDYFSAPGVKKTIDEFFQDKPETIIGLSDSQCLIVKI